MDSSSGFIVTAASSCSDGGGHGDMYMAGEWRCRDRG